MLKNIESLLKIKSDIKNYILEDASHRYGLKQPVSYTLLTKRWNKTFSFHKEILYLDSIEENEKSLVKVTIDDFPPESNFWDGTSLLKDSGSKDLDALFLASLPHDVIYQLVEIITKESNLSENQVLGFADDMLKLLADAYGCNKKKSYGIFVLTRLFGSLYHKIKKLFVLSILTGILTGIFLSGCVSSELLKYPSKIDWYTSESTSESTSEVTIDESTSESTSQINNSVNNFQIVPFGSPDVSKSQEDASVQIADLKVTSDGLSWKWLSKGNRWGVKDDEIALLAILGYSSDGKTYRCAKFDWSRFANTTRDFKNLKSGYNSWNWSDFQKAPFVCYFLTDKDCKKRTNIITIKK